MPTHYTILYYAPDETMGDTPARACERYRDWALRELTRAYPRHHVRVLAEPGTRQAWTNDEQHAEAIYACCARLWDACPWDWEDN